MQSEARNWFTPLILIVLLPSALTLLRSPALVDPALSPFSGQAVLQAADPTSTPQASPGSPTSQTIRPTATPTLRPPSQRHYGLVAGGILVFSVILFGILRFARTKILLR